MEFPYELENILKRDNNGFIVLESSIYDYINNYEKNYISQIIDYIGQSSNSERHLYKQITSSESFFNRKNMKTLLIKLEKNIIIGFILYEYRFVLLRNEFNLSYFSKILLTISDFYVFRNYQRMNYGKKLFEKLIQITKTKPVSMAFEFPNKALINFLYKNYNIGNPIYQINNIITYYSFNDQNFNKYLDDRHRPIDVNKMENDIDNYKKWSLFDKDYKIFNSDYSYKNIFPLKFKNNKINRMDELTNIKNIENNYFNNRLYNNIYRNKKEDKNNMRYSFDFKNQRINSNNNSFNNNNYSSDYIKFEQDEKNKINNNNIHKDERNNPINIKKKYHLIDKKNIYGKKRNIIDNLNSDYIKYTNEPINNKNEYYSKFNDYYINRDGIKNNSNYYNKNSIRENYYNYINDEDMYFKNMLNKQMDYNIKLSQNVENLNNRIFKNKNEISLKNNYYFKDIYYHKNKSFATLYDSIQNKLHEEKDFNNYKKYQISKEYSNL